MRINTTLQDGRLQKWSETFLLLAVCFILIFSDMPTWGKGLALLFLGFYVAYQHLIQPPPRLIQLIQFDKKTWRWLVQEPSRVKKTNIYEGRLVSVQGGLFVLVLRFETIEKKKLVTKNWVIWRDQVDMDHWRRLIVMARFWADDVQRAIN